jgi:ABC-type polysaccharide/polyol phosphate export permease
MAVFVTLYRQALLGAGGAVDLELMAYVVIVSAFVGSIGFLVFQRAAKWFADVV